MESHGAERNAADLLGSRLELISDAVNRMNEPRFRINSLDLSPQFFYVAVDGAVADDAFVRVDFVHELFTPVDASSIQGRPLDGVLSLETGYYDSRQDRHGADPMIPNSQMRYLIGYQRQLWEDFTLGLQYYSEYMQDYSAYVQNLPSGFPQEKRLHQLTSVRLTQFMIHQTLRLSFFAFYGLSDRDYLLNPEVKYNLTDSVWIALGGNVFGGRPWSQFGQFSKDDNVYCQIRYEF